MTASYNLWMPSQSNAVFANACNKSSTSRMYSALKSTPQVAVAGIADLNISEVADRLQELNYVDLLDGEKTHIQGQMSSQAQNPWAGISGIKNLSFNLTFMLAEPQSLQEVRIDAVPLLHLLTDVEDNREFTIIVKHPKSLGPMSCTTLQLQDIRKAVHEAWLRIWEPLYAPNRKLAESSLQEDLSDPFPEIWLDGTGKVVEAKYPEVVMPIQTHASTMYEEYEVIGEIALELSEEDLQYCLWMHYEQQEKQIDTTDMVTWRPCAWMALYGLTKGVAAKQWDEEELLQGGI